MILLKTDYKAERALRAMQEISETAERNGVSEMSLDEINAEIAAARYAMQILQSEMAGEAERTGLVSDEEVNKLVKEVRSEGEKQG